MEHIINTEQMNSMKVLADTAMKISEAKGILFKLQETETAYLEAREKKALAKIQKLFVDSQDLLDKTRNNHEQIEDYARTVSEVSLFLGEMYDKFQKMLDNFNDRNELWDKNIKKQGEIIATQRKQIELDQKKIEADEKRLKEYDNQLQKEKTLIESRQQALLASYKVEKELWNKISKKS